MNKFQHTSFKNVGEFLDYIPEEEREIVETLRAIILECISNSKEKLSYNVPFYYRQSRVCFVWPASVPWGGISSGVALGFCQGHLISDEINYLERGNRKYVRSKTFHSVQEIEPELLQSYLYEAVEIDEMSKRRVE